MLEAQNKLCGATLICNNEHFSTALAWSPLHSTLSNFQCDVQCIWNIFFKHSILTGGDWRWHIYHAVLLGSALDFYGRWQFKWIEIEFFRLSACNLELLTTKASEGRLEQFLSVDLVTPCGICCLGRRIYLGGKILAHLEAAQVCFTFFLLSLHDTVFERT